MTYKRFLKKRVKIGGDGCEILDYIWLEPPTGDLVYWQQEIV